MPAYSSFNQTKDDWLVCDTKNLGAAYVNDDKGYAGDIFLERYVETFRKSLELKVKAPTNIVPSEDELTNDDEATVGGDTSEILERNSSYAILRNCSYARSRFTI